MTAVGGELKPGSGRTSDVRLCAHLGPFGRHAPVLKTRCKRPVGDKAEVRRTPAIVRTHFAVRVHR